MADVGGMSAADALRYSATRSELAPFIPANARRVLDVGCGTGGFGSTVRSVLPHTELWGIEPVPEAAEAAARTYDQVRTGFFPDRTLGLEPQTFDVVFMLDVIEHLADPEPALHEARTLLREGGVLIASIPNARHFDVWWPLVRHGTWTYTETGLMDRTHLRWFTRSSIVDLLSCTGWTIDRLEGINRSAPVGWKAKALERLARGSEEFFAVQYAVVARPAGAP